MRPPRYPLPIRTLPTRLCDTALPAVPRRQYARGDGDDLVVQRRQGGEFAAADGAEGSGKGRAGLGGGVCVGSYAGGAGVQGVLLEGRERSR